MSNPPKISYFRLAVVILTAPFWLPLSLLATLAVFIWPPKDTGDADQYGNDL